MFWLLCPKINCNFLSGSATPRFSTESNRPRHWTHSWATFIYVTSPQSVVLKSIWMLSSHLFLDVLHGRFSWDFPTKILCWFLGASIRASWPTDTVPRLSCLCVRNETIRSCVCGLQDTLNKACGSILKYTTIVSFEISYSPFLIFFSFYSASVAPAVEAASLNNNKIYGKGG